MAVLLDQPGKTMSALADAAVLPSGTLTRHIDRLVERGLVVRRVHPGDRRRVTAALPLVGLAVAQRPGHRGRRRGAAARASRREC